MSAEIAIDRERLVETASRMIGTRGVIHGGAEYVAEDALSLSSTGRRVNFHEHEGGHSHAHPHTASHPHAHAKAPAVKLGNAKTPRVKRLKTRR